MTRSFDKVYSENYSKVLNHIQYKINNREDAEDITANVFIKLHKAFDTYNESKAALTTWLFTIAKNAIIDYHRANKDSGMTQFMGDYVDENGNETFFVKDVTTPQTVLEHNEILSLVNKAIEGLSKNYRNVAKDYFLKQCTYEEVAKNHNVPLGTVKGTVSRIREKLQAQLKGY